MEKKHYLLTTTTYEDGYQARNLEQSSKEFADYRIPLPNRPETVQEGRCYRTIEDVKDRLLWEFLNNQFETQNLEIVRYASEETGIVMQYAVRHMILDEELCVTDSWDGVMDYWTKYWGEDRFELCKRVREMENQSA